LVGCGGDESDPTTTGTSNTTNPGVGSTVTGTSGGGSSSTSTTGEPSGPCSMTPPPNTMISDFSDWSGNNWGADGNLTGGSFQYTGANTETFEYLVDLATEEMHITGVVNDYAGFGMWFGPCTDASDYTGITFDISGDLGEEGELQFQVQTSENQTIDEENMRGECEEDCQNAGAVVEGVSADVMTVELTWADFSGGSPVATLSPDQILGLQWQFNCETDAMCE